MLRMVDLVLRTGPPRSLSQVCQELPSSVAARVFTAGLCEPIVIPELEPTCPTGPAEGTGANVKLELAPPCPTDPAEGSAAAGSIVLAKEAPVPPAPAVVFCQCSNSHCFLSACNSRAGRAHHRKKVGHAVHTRPGRYLLDHCSLRAVKGGTLCSLCSCVSPGCGSHARRPNRFCGIHASLDSDNETTYVSPMGEVRQINPGWSQGLQFAAKLAWAMRHTLPQDLTEWADWASELVGDRPPSQWAMSDIAWLFMAWATKWPAATAKLRFFASQRGDEAQDVVDKMAKSFVAVGTWLSDTDDALLQSFLPHIDDNLVRLHIGWPGSALKWQVIRRIPQAGDSKMLCIDGFTYGFDEPAAVEHMKDRIQCWLQELEVHWPKVLNAIDSGSLSAMGGALVELSRALLSVKLKGRSAKTGYLVRHFTRHMLLLIDSVWVRSWAPSHPFDWRVGTSASLTMSQLMEWLPDETGQIDCIQDLTTREVADTLCEPLVVSCWACFGKALSPSQFARVMSGQPRLLASVVTTWNSKIVAANIAEGTVAEGTVDRSRMLLAMGFSPTARDFAVAAGWAPEPVPKKSKRPRPAGNNKAS